MNKKQYCVVGRHPWNRKHFEELLADAEGKWDFIDNQDDLLAIPIDPSPYRYVFFLHWSKKIPDDFLTANECVCFHMTDVPFGRGGSPLQNLIARGHRDTLLTALRMTEDFDAGPVYAKTPLSLEGGTAEEIYIRASKICCQLALQIARDEPTPVPQTGDPVIFKRRTPEQSILPAEAETLEEVFDRIRMLDCEGYPSAFIDHGRFRISFKRAALYSDRVEANVIIRKHATQQPSHE